MRICPDTSVLFPYLLRHHEQYPVVRAEIGSIHERGDELMFAAHSLVETYSTLSRIPPRFRLPADVVFDSIEKLIAGAHVSALTAEEYVALLRSVASRGITGGRVYDALIAASAVKGGAGAILTFNTRHFEGLEPSLQVLAPGTGA